MRRPLALAAALAAVALVATGCSLPRQAAEDAWEYEHHGTFYEVPSPLPAGEPGSIIKSERLLGAPDGARAWRVLYRSTDLDGEPIAVSGVVVAPDAPSIHGPRPIVSWAHPTTGAKGERCAPSSGVDPFILMEGLHELLAKGYVVAATDYSGMGAAGPATYLIGGTEGRNVLDAARAARELDDTFVGDDVVLWGHSQGGQAALFAAQLADGYAPDLDVKGVAVAAPAGELAELLDDDIGDVSGVTIGAYAFDAFERVYGPSHPGLELTDVLTPEGAAAVPEMAPLCLLGQNKELHEIARPLIGHFLAEDPAATEPWATFLEENTPGGEPIDVPILIAQGGSDTLVKPETNQRLAERLCEQGEHVLYRQYPRMDHATIAYRTVPLLTDWAGDVVHDRPTKTTC